MNIYERIKIIEDFYHEPLFLDISKQREYKMKAIHPFFSFGVLGPLAVLALMALSIAITGSAAKIYAVPSIIAFLILVGSLITILVKISIVNGWFEKNKKNHFQNYLSEKNIKEEDALEALGFLQNMKLLKDLSC